MKNVFKSIFLLLMVISIASCSQDDVLDNLEAQPETKMDLVPVEDVSINFQTYSATLRPVDLTICPANNPIGSGNAPIGVRTGNRSAQFASSYWLKVRRTQDTGSSLEVKVKTQSPNGSDILDGSQDIIINGLESDWILVESGELNNTDPGRIGLIIESVSGLQLGASTAFNYACQ